MNIFLENDLSEYLALNGEWSFSLAGSSPKSIPIPSAWEAYVHDKRIDGPAFYRREFDLSSDWLDGRRVLFEAGAVSFAVTVRVNGQDAGFHQGMWSRFQLDVTPLVRPGRNEIELEVWKPGGRFPLRETLAGFLPDVCTTFGGPWQALGLRGLRTAITDLRVAMEPPGLVSVGGSIVPGAQTVQVEIQDHAGLPLGQAASVLTDEGAFSVTIPTAQLPPWRPEAPRMVTVGVTVVKGEAPIARAIRQVGLRKVGAIGSAMWLDDRPLHLRGVLDWGWDPGLIRPSPSREMVRRQFEQARSLGFNLIKLCLFVPDDATFDVADEMGMMLWLELPMWLPHVTPGLKHLALAEYAAILKRVHHHPSLVVLSLGCELQSNADAGFLQRLGVLARHWLPNVLHCDNSGSAEAYGGAATNLSDVYDYHFYTDPHFFQPLVEHFDRGYRTRKPWLYGEFCDVDTGRDFSTLEPLPWWMNDPVPLARDDFLAQREGPARLTAAGLTDGGAALTRIAERQATAIRKFILEQTRAHDATGGYVISGWADTPITTSGIVDDLGRLKFEPDDWRDFNADAVLLIDRERRRRWAGGDRPAPRDPFSWWAGEPAEIHVLVSNGFGAARGGRLRWSLEFEDERVWATGEAAVGTLAAGEVQEIAMLSVPMPTVAPAPDPGIPALLGLNLKMILDVMSEAGEPRAIRNEWRLWAVPRVQLPSPLALAGLLEHDNGFARLESGFRSTGLAALPLTTPFVTDVLTPSLLERLHRGGRGLFWVRRPDARLTRAVPFWREAIHVFEPHAIWQRVPHLGYADMRFYSLATDFALDEPALQALLGSKARCRPVWRRFDARRFTWSAHLIDVEYGAGRLFVSGLRFEGGLGRQPDTLDTNPIGAWMLASLLAELTE